MRFEQLEGMKLFPKGTPMEKEKYALILRNKGGQFVRNDQNCQSKTVREIEKNHKPNVSELLQASLKSKRRKGLR